MTSPQAQQSRNLDPKSNAILAKLSREDYDAVMAKARVVTVKFRKRIYQQDAAIDAIYFPITSMVSLIVSTKRKAQMEMATIGKEGVVGAVEAMQRQGALGLHVIQLSGTAVRIPSGSFLAEIARRPQVASVIFRHQYALTRQILTGAACNRVHSMEERCARWLLMTHDRAGQDSFPLTQEFLSHMLGVRRATVNVATGMLKKAGFIRYVRGIITVTDRRGLQSSACECYQAIVQTYDSAMKDGTG